MVEIINKISVPNLAQQNGLSVAPWTQVHLHSTANPNSSMQNELDYLKGHYQEANYTHLCGWNPATNKAETWQVMKCGGAYDAGGVSNWDGWASIELVEGSIKNKEQFNAVYKQYILSARKFADEIKVGYTLDGAGNHGIKTHNWLSKNGTGSDHTDPLGFLANWGVSYDQLIKDINSLEAPSPVLSPIQQFKNAGNKFSITKQFRADEVKLVDGMWQVINYELAGGKNFSWTNNGIPLAICIAVDINGNKLADQNSVKNGSYLKINSSFNHGLIDKYDDASNGVGITFGPYGMIWFNASALLKY